MVSERSASSHPTDEELAAYLGKELRGDHLRRVESHLAACPTCREELIDAMEVLRSPRRSRWTILAPAAAAVAAVVLLVTWPQGPNPPTGRPAHRESPSEAVVTPVPVSPIGTVDIVEAFRWEGFPGADRYRVTLFDAEGSVLWKPLTEQSEIELPDSVTLTIGQPYLWTVEARVGWDVWETSDLVEFSLVGGTGSSPMPEGTG
ncbi:MAG: zf-HC2 domain-containing protein [Gemmatimonadota bacterium]|jgi:hypothetical protein